MLAKRLVVYFLLLIIFANLAWTWTNEYEPSPLFNLNPYPLEKAPANFYSNVKEPMSSAVYSLVCPGLGHLYNEQPDKAMRFSILEVGTLVLWQSNPRYNIFGVILLFLHVYDVDNAYNSARKINFYLSTHEVGIRHSFDWSNNKHEKDFK